MSFADLPGRENLRGRSFYQGDQTLEMSWTRIAEEAEQPIDASADLTDPNAIAAGQLARDCQAHQVCKGEAGGLSRLLSEVRHGLAPCAHVAR